MTMPLIHEGHYARGARIKREQAIMDKIWPDADEAIDKILTAITDAKEAIEVEYALMRRRIVGSAYERLTLAGALVDMTDEDAATLADELDGLTFDDVLACIDGLRGKVAALKAKAESAS